MAQNKVCPKCRETGHDSRGDHLWLMQKGDRWACYKKEYHEDGQNYYEDLDGNAQRDFVSTFSAEPVGPTVYSFGPLLGSFRGIDPSIFHKFGTEGAYHGTDLVALGHTLYDTSGKEVTRKVRKLPKNFFTEVSTKKVPLQLFGQSVFPRAKRLLITEGELDCMSAYSMLQQYRVACVSLPLGANVKALMDNLEYLKGFKEVYCCMDQDEVGSSVSRDIANLIPHARFMRISEKDANDMLQEGKQQEFISAFWDASIYKPEFLVQVSDIMDKVMKKPTMGEPWPWPTLTKLTYGRNDGEGMYVGAGVKIGKSEFINELIAFDLKRGKKVGILKYEEKPWNTVKRVAGKVDKTFYHKPDMQYNDADLERTSLSFQGNLLMYPAFGPAVWESTRDFIRYAALSGCKTIIIDPITKLTNHLSSSETETELRKISDDLACIASDLGFFYIVTCHLKAPVTGPPHERGGKVQSNQFRGSRAMMENCFYMLGIERNKDPELSEKERNTSTFVLLEDRNFGNSDRFPVYYNLADQSYLEPVLSF